MVSVLRIPDSQCDASVPTASAVAVGDPVPVHLTNQIGPAPVTLQVIDSTLDTYPTTPARTT